MEEAVQAMEAAGWRIEMSRGHIWAKAKCPAFTPDGCIAHIHSTPKKPENHAKRLQALKEACDHGSGN